MREWFLSELDLEYVALGAAILGTGGGGNAYLGKLRAWEQLRAGRRIRIIPPEALKDDDLVIAVGGIGAPTVGIEKIERGDEGLLAVRAIEKEVGKPAAALMTDEIGGANSIEPMIAAALADLPMVDVDGMGRAFPELQMNTFFIYGLKPWPGALCDEKGNTVVFTDVQSPLWLEKLARAGTVAMGCTAAFALPPITGQQVNAWGVKYTVSQVWRLGRTVIEARAEKRDPVAAILAHEHGKLLFKGKIVDVARWTTGGFARGRLEIEGFDTHQKQTLQIEFQNENLIARAAERGDVIATVPDLICIVDSETGRPISTEETRYGLRVSVLGLPATPLFRTPEALAVIGPRAFGYDVDYQPLGEYVMPEPVVTP
ncbi:MAG TPA: DUF917 domain-containing protein [Anaerolineales bacterium]|nr:DUF917 domain-containing protein [Anaerolineales bacterium]